jgi:hypothetical protein
MMKRFGGSIGGRLAKRAKMMASSAIKSIVKQGVSRFKHTYKCGVSKAKRAFHMLTNKSTLFLCRQTQGVTNYGSANGAGTAVLKALELTDTINTQGTT